MNFFAKFKSPDTSLHKAVATGDLARVQQLVQTGANIEGNDKEGCTALHVAATRGFTPIVGELLDRLATSTCVNSAGMTPVHLACEYGHSASVFQLLGARNRKDSQQAKLQLVNSRDQAGRTPLILANLGSHLQLALDLIQYGADLNVMDASGCTAFMSAAQRGDVHAMKALREKGAQLDGPRLAEGWTPMHSAAAAGHQDAVMWLIGSGADMTTRDNQGQTAVDLALKNGFIVLYRKLKELMPAAAAAAATAAGPSVSMSMEDPAVPAPQVLAVGAVSTQARSGLAASPLQQLVEEREFFGQQGGDSRAVAGRVVDAENDMVIHNASQFLASVYPQVPPNNVR